MTADRAVYRDYCGASLGESANEIPAPHAGAVSAVTRAMPVRQCFFVRCHIIPHYKKRYRNLKISLVLDFRLP
ncbi:protein of unknown function [Cupriavidus taiwanensis]|uniref:Uncharacterized protein n=1 Tax=Cupriavidus taiwanensis TaxID=164546 RepID=A0A7Z7J9H9_9BURK|nr:protein of unknown function [Cupriavidus taiwanensis]SOZ05203.1 hypothetical protein CBM2597_A51155 [Cupriavidus taiwanensis]SPC09686.1 hypothetical protein CBM2594_A41009 [Cupriavidus taiwanensis]SPD39472.1 protein of unknown function [Cupriavidus taiwanensis]